MNTPIYDELVAKLGFGVPDPLTPISSLLPISDAATITTALPVVRAPAVRLPSVPPRVDDWCEDRPPSELENEGK